MQKLMSLVGVIVCFLVITGFFVTQRITDFKSPPQNIHTSALGNNIRFYDNYYDQSEWPWFNHYTDDYRVKDNNERVGHWLGGYGKEGHGRRRIKHAQMQRRRVSLLIYTAVSYTSVRAFYRRRNL